MSVIWQSARRVTLMVSPVVLPLFRPSKPTYEEVSKAVCTEASATHSVSVPVAAPVSEVIKAVVHALTASPPRARYPVGKGIGLATAAVRMVPSKWMDFLLSGRI